MGLKLKSEIYVSSVRAADRSGQEGNDGWIVVGDRVDIVERHQT
jgi:hypothetical protein